MATVSTQASAAVFRPCAYKSRFLAGAPSKLNRELSIKPMASSSPSFKVEAKKGEWLPGLPSPSYLNGSLPGDNGFDPLGLAEDPENLRWFVQAELVNGRWAMLGVAGMLLPEVFTKIGIINAPQWYDAGKAEYFASSSTLFVIEFILFHYVEIRRWQDIKNPGCVNQDPIFKQYSLPPNECGYPGGIFNPLNFAPTLEAKEKELANGRLAMLAFLGFVIQHNVTGKGPFENLLQHISDPWHNTIVQTFSGTGSQVHGHDQVRPILEDTHPVLQSKKKDHDEHIADGRKIVELNDYPGSGANNRHTPRPQFGRCVDC